MEKVAREHLLIIILYTMAEINSPSVSLRGETKSKLIPRVDMTPMVDLMFLLITFFMLTTTLSKPTSISLSMPVGKKQGLAIADFRTINICLGEDDKILWYIGDSEKLLSTPAIESFGRSGIRKTLKAQNLKVTQRTKSPSKGLIALIKPGEKSAYRNLIDILDELKIAGISTYFITDMSSADLKRMEEKLN